MNYKVSDDGRIFHDYGVFFSDFKDTDGNKYINEYNWSRPISDIRQVLWS